MGKRDLILFLRKPAKFAITSRPIEEDRFVIDGIPVFAAGFPSWIGCADILFEPKARLFLGLTFQVFESKWRPIRSLCSEFDPAVARYDDLSSEAAQRCYPGESGDVHRLELAWATSAVMDCKMAQLAEPYWCYADHSNQEAPTVVAVGMSDIEGIVAEYALRLPEVSLPRLAVGKRTN